MKAALAGSVKTIAPTVLSIERHPTGVTCTIGELSIDGVSFCHTLEPQKAIPAGTYRIVLTESGRARRGELWCPGADRTPPHYLLPLVLAVPQHEGIRIHAGNTAKDTAGCILAGTWRGGELLTNSRAMLSSVMDMLEIAEIARRPITIEIKDAR